MIKHTLKPHQKRLNQNELNIILDALNRVAAELWDEASYGPRPDFETVIERVQDKIKPVKFR